MSDERLEAGRHHLRNGHRALELGYSEEGRSFFEAAILQFRGPELRLGEAHAYRGLAQVELASGETSQAEAHARASIEIYDELVDVLDALNDPLATAEIRSDARSGSAASRVVLAEVFSRTQRVVDAESTLQIAKETFQDLGSTAAAAGVWSALGRLALHTGRDDEAHRWFTRALEAHRTLDDTEGQVAALLMVAEHHRLRGDLDDAESHLIEGRMLARQSDMPGLEGRVLSALGNVCLQAGRLDEAQSYLEDALDQARGVGDVERQAYGLVALGGAASRAGQADALDRLLAGARLFASLDHHLGLANALCRIGVHARRHGAPVLALVACEAARRLWSGTDPVRGQGQALRHVVKALTSLRQGRASLVAALAREALVGSDQPNATDVADWFRERAPQGTLDALGSLGAEGLLTETRREVERVVGPALRQVDREIEDLGSPLRAFAVVESIAAISQLASYDSPASISIDALDPPSDSEDDELLNPHTPPIHVARRDVAPGGGTVEELYASLFEGQD